MENAMTGAPQFIWFRVADADTCSAMLIWEYLITVDQEISLVWRKKQKVSMPSILLVTIRICMLSTAVGFGIAYLPGLSCTVGS